MKKAGIIGSIIIILVIAVVGFFLVKSNGNRQIGFDMSNNFNHYLITIGNQTLEGEIKSWRDFTDGDCVQILTEDGQTYLTHYSNVLMIHKVN